MIKVKLVKNKSGKWGICNGMISEKLKNGSVIGGSESTEHKSLNNLVKEKGCYNPATFLTFLCHSNLKHSY